MYIATKLSKTYILCLGTSCYKCEKTSLDIDNIDEPVQSLKAFHLNVLSKMKNIEL